MHFIVFFLIFVGCRKLPCCVQTAYLNGYWLLNYFSSLYKETNIILVLREPGRERRINQRFFQNINVRNKKCYCYVYENEQ